MARRVLSFRPRAWRKGQLRDSFMHPFLQVASVPLSGDLKLTESFGMMQGIAKRAL